MLSTDALGLDMTTASPEAVEPWSRVVSGALAHARATPDALADLLAIDPGNTLAWAAKSLFLTMLARPEMTDSARDAASRAADGFARRGGTSREGQYAAAALLASQGHWWQAIAELEAILEDSPEDSLAAKLSHGLRFMLGDGRGMRRSIENVLGRVGRDHPHIGYLLGCKAFALEEAGDYAEAEATGRIAVARAPKDAWGLHAVSHVHEMTGRAEEGAQWLSGREASWSHCNNFGYHVFWHLALFRLEQGDHEGVLALYDDRIRKDRTDDFRDIANAASLLARLELAGADVKERWEEIADLARSRVTDRTLVFADLHYLIALLGAGQDSAADALIEGFGKPGRTAAQEEPTLAAGRPAALGLAAFKRGRYEEASRHLMHARKALQSIGGSHAQRDIFEQFTIEALIRAGDHDRAEPILRDRLQRRGGHNAFAARRLGALSGDATLRLAALAAASGDIKPD